jgi:flagellar hook protein FlgE
MVIPSLFTGAGALTTQQTAISVIANNIANANTTSFKSSRVHFSEETSNLLTPASSPSSSRGGTNPNQVGTGMRVSDISPLFTQGSLKNTGLATDLAISGQGFFVVSSPMLDDESTINNPQFTRDGHFAIDKVGNLVSADGSRVLGATIYNSSDGRIKDLDGYSNISYFMNQKVGELATPSYLPNDGIGGNPPVPSPTITHVTGSPPVFQANKIAEISVRGGLVDQNSAVDTTTNGDITISRREDGKLMFTFDNANAGTAASIFSVAVDTTQQVLDSVTTFDMINDLGNKIQIRIRLEPGIPSLEDIFSNVDYDTISTSSDSIVFSGSSATTQSGTRITMADQDLELISASDLMKLVSPIKIPNFFYTQKTSTELETGGFTIASNGAISIFGPASDELKLGRILVANFKNPNGLMNDGGNKYRESSNSGFAAISVIDGPFNRNAPSLSGASIVSGSLESSNVNLANEFAELISFQRGLQANSRVISTSDEILQTLINL